MDLKLFSKSDLLLAAAVVPFLLSVSFLAASDLLPPLPPLPDDAFLAGGSSLASLSFSYLRFAFGMGWKSLISCTIQVS